MFTKLYLRARCLADDVRGLSSMEYAILVGVVGVGLVAVLNDVPDAIEDFIDDMMKDVDTAADKANK